jgi:hypothetical protein
VSNELNHTVTPAKAGVQKPGIWIPAQGRNDGIRVASYFHDKDN